MKWFSVLPLVVISYFLCTTSVAAEDSDVFTNIILINGQAELVDFNEDGQVLTRHISIPDYFSSGRSHKRSLRQSMKSLKVYGSHTPKLKRDFYHSSRICRQSLMAVSDKVDADSVNSKSQWNPIETSRLDADLSIFNSLSIQLANPPIYPVIMDKQRMKARQRYANIAWNQSSLYQTSKAIAKYEKTITNS